MSKGNTTAQELTSTISAESILIIGESNWIQMLLHVKREQTEYSMFKWLMFN